MRFKLFSYLSIDHKAAQADLNAMAAGGWQLKKIYGGLLARFARTDRTDLAYFVDLADPQYKEDPHYLTLCADAGWDEVCAPRYMRVYESRPGCSPAPIQTDGGVEYERFLHICFRRMLITLGVAALAVLLYGLLFLLVFRSVFIRIITGSFIGNLAYLGLLPLLVGLFIYALCILFRIRAWKSLRLCGEPIPIPRFAHLRGILTVLGSLCCILIALAIALDYIEDRRLSTAGVFVGMLAAILMALCYKEKHPQRRVSFWAGVPVLCVFVLTLLLRSYLPINYHIPLTVTPDPLPAALTAQTSGIKTNAYWLSAYERWNSSLEELQSFSADRHTLRTPALAESVYQSYLEPYMEPVPGMANSWWTPDGKRDWRMSELVFLRDNTVWYFTFYTTSLPPDLPEYLDKLITGQEALS